MPESYKMAEQRLIGIEKKIKRNPVFGTAYNAIISRYIDKKYARKLSPTEILYSSPNTWYLPHFAVFNPNKPSKIRVVFDAAAVSHGVSLNSQPLKGSEIFKPMPSIFFYMCRYRRDFPSSHYSA